MPDLIDDSLIPPEPELLPCPMCGAVAPEVELCGKYHPQGTRVQCHGCGLRTQRFDRVDKAIGVWNMRRPPVK